MNLLALLAAVGALAGPTPDGFRESARLASIASGMAGTPTFVRCAVTEDSWRTFLAPWPHMDPQQLGGATFPNDTGTYLAPTTCRYLEGWLRGKNVPTLRRLGESVLLLVHETWHVRGVAGESEADCRALRDLPGVLRTRFGIKRATTMRTVMASAWAIHRRQPADYRTLC